MIQKSTTQVSGASFVSNEGFGDPNKMDIEKDKRSVRCCCWSRVCGSGGGGGGFFLPHYSAYGEEEFGRVHHLSTCV